MKALPRVRLVVAAALFLGWIGWLSYTAATKTRAPIVSRVQAAVATHPVVGEVTAGPDGKPVSRVKVETPLTDKGPTAGTTIEVVNLPEKQGFGGTGKYLLLLVPDREPGKYRVVGPQRSPGYEVTESARPPLVYPWSPDVEAQAKGLLK